MSEWISVDVRLPKYTELVLVAICPPSQMNEVQAAIFWPNVIPHWDVISAKGNHADFITDWQPLPEPPQDS